MFFKEDLVLYSADNNNWLEYSINMLSQNPEIKHEFIDFMQSIGTGLVAVRARIEQKKFDPNQLPAVIPELLKNLITSQDTNIIDADAKLQYDLFVLDLLEESSGIKKLFEVLCRYPIN